MNPAFQVGECPLFLGESNPGQNDVGNLGHRTQKGVVNHQKIQLPQSRQPIAQLSIGEIGAVANHHHCLDTSFGGPTDDCGQTKPRIGRQCDSPGFLEHLTGIFVANRLVTGKPPRHAANVPGPLLVGPLSHGIDAGPRLAQIAGHQHQVDQRPDTVLP